MSGTVTLAFRGDSDKVSAQQIDCWLQQAYEGGGAAFPSALSPVHQPAPLQWLSQYPQVAEYAWAPGTVLLPVLHAARATPSADAPEFTATFLWCPGPSSEASDPLAPTAKALSLQLYALGWNRDVIDALQGFVGHVRMDDVRWQDLFSLFDPCGTGVVAVQEVQLALAALRSLPLPDPPLWIPSTAERLLCQGMKQGRYTFESFKAHLSHPDFLQRWCQAVEDEAVGMVTVKFSAYADQFPIQGGRLHAAVLDEKWAISFAFSDKAVMRLHMPDGSEQAIGLQGTFEGLKDGATYAMECDEDDEVLAKEVHRRIRFNAEPGNSCQQPSAAFNRLTNELKQLSPDDLRAQTEQYKQLLAARDMAELGWS
eukprot:GGOE01043337.1.p1 GENE.GGOE01043337.1~~GGOE01043337.1.p1  ORF type:complete len:427 (-),score=125.59 GGOE01043337.1:199-1305(-)